MHRILLATSAASLWLMASLGCRIAPSPQKLDSAYDAVFQAVIANQVWVLTELITQGAFVDGVQPVTLETPLLAAARLGHEKMLVLLMNASANIYALDAHGRSVAHIAAINDQGGIIDELAVRNVNLSTLDNHGNTPLHLAAQLGKKNAVNALLKRGVLVNPRNFAGGTPLIRATRQRQTEVVEILLKNGALPTQTNRVGESALSLAIKANATDLIDLLTQTQKYTFWERVRRYLGWE